MVPIYEDIKGKRDSGMQAFWADVIVAVHLAYIAFVVVGQLAIMAGVFLKWGWVRNPIFRCTHLVMICIVALEALVDFECPLTTWENQVRNGVWQQLQPALTGSNSLGLGSSPFGQGALLTLTALQDDRIPRIAGTFIGRCLDGIVFVDCPEGRLVPFYYG